MSNLISIQSAPRRPVCKSANSARLTRRELEVLSFAGDTDVEIAYALETSYHTIRAHFRNIAMKLGTASRTEAYAAVFGREERRAA